MKTEINFLYSAALFVAFVFSLNGCSSNEPTETDMFQAMIEADPNHRMFGDLARIVVEAKKSECEKIRERTYKCGIVWKNGKGRVFPFIIFTKAGNKWIVAI